jgi:hypothetical protein
MKRPAAIAAVFFAAALAGWFGVSAPVSSATAVEKPVVAPKAFAPMPLPPAREPLGPDAPGLEALERDFLRALHPVPGSYSGERLAELCLEDHPGNLPGPNVAFSYARAWAAQDPAGMFAWFQQRGGFTLPAHDGNYLFLNILFREWANKDPEAALKAAVKCYGKRSKSGALKEIVTALMLTDAAKAQAVALEHMDLMGKDSYGFAFRASGKDYRERWNLLTALPAGTSRDKMLAVFFQDIAQHHGKDIAAMWQEMPADLQKAVVAGGFTPSSLGDVESANGSPATLPGLDDLLRERAAETGDARTWLRTEGARQWAQQDVAGALTWTDQHLKGRQRVDAAVQLLGAAAETQFEAAMQQWQSLPGGILRARAAGHIAGNAPPARAAEVEALLATLSPADRNLAVTEQRTAAQQARQRASEAEARKGPRPQG